MVTLVIGLPGSGKTEYVRDHLGIDGIAYDMDYIAKALRLGTMINPDSRFVANAISHGFYRYASEYCSDVYIIRIAPRLDDVESMHPDRIIYCSVNNPQVKIKNRDRETYIRHINDVINYAKQNNIRVIEHNNPPLPGENVE